MSGYIRQNLTTSTTSRTRFKCPSSKNKTRHVGLNGRVQEVMQTVLVCNRIWKSEASAAERNSINKQVSSKDRRERN